MSANLPVSRFEEESVSNWIQSLRLYRPASIQRMQDALYLYQAYEDPREYYFRMPHTEIKAGGYGIAIGPNFIIVSKGGQQIGSQSYFTVYPLDTLEILQILEKLEGLAGYKSADERFYASLLGEDESGHKRLSIHLGSRWQPWTERSCTVDYQQALAAARLSASLFHGVAQAAPATAVAAS